MRESQSKFQFDGPGAGRRLEESSLRKEIIQPGGG
jgi:hypothetical protein